MTALKLGRNLSCFASHHRQNLSLWPRTFGSFLPRLNTACPWQRTMNGIVATLPSPLVVASLPDGDQPLYYLHLQGSNTVTLAGASVLSLLLAFVPPLMDCPTPIYSMADSGLNFIRMVTHMSVPFCHLNSRHALD